MDSPRDTMAEGPVFRLAKGVLTAREAIAIGAVVIAMAGGGSGAWAWLQSDVKSLAKDVTDLGKRADQIDAGMKDMKNKIDETHDTTLELRANQHETRSQLDRIEYSLTGHPARGAPPAGGSK